MLQNFVTGVIAVASLTVVACSPTDTSDSATTASTPDTGTSAILAEDHFHPKGKAPSQYTLEVLEQARKTLPFDDTRDFDEQEQGFIAAPESWQIMANAGNVAWDMERYKFFLEGKDFDSIHPSLQRQSTLNMNFGLYEVIPLGR